MAKFRKFKINEELFDEWSADMAYILGFIATDGNVYRSTLSIKIQLKDIEILEFFRSKLGDVKLEINEKQNWARVRFNSCSLVARLENFGIHPNKSHSIDVPVSLPKEYEGDYLRGVFDGDGCIHTRKYGLTAEIYSGSLNFINHLNLMINQIANIKVRDYANDSTRKPQYHLNIQNNKNIVLLRDKIYQNNNFGLSRKRNLFFSKFTN